MLTEVHIKDKEAYLKENFIFGEIPKMTDTFDCLHCGEVIVAGEYKVYKNEEGFEFICCPNAPDCNGTAIDWMPVGLFKFDDGDEDEE